MIRSPAGLDRRLVSIRCGQLLDRRETGRQGRFLWRRIPGSWVGHLQVERPGATGIARGVQGADRRRAPGPVQRPARWTRCGR